MSGDVQPRKRKDKKRRKDDIDPVPVQLHPSIINHTNNSASEDVNIHVHKEGGTGGNLCAKLVFFVLFSALAVLIGLIITEHRGLTDLDSVDTESRFSHIFEGLVDSGKDEHDHEDHGIEEALNSAEADQVYDQYENDEELDASEPEDEEETPGEEEDKSRQDEHSQEEEDSRADDLEEENDDAVSEEREDDDEEDEDIQNDEDEDDIAAEDDEILEDDDEEVEDTVEQSDENDQDQDHDSDEDGEDRDEVGTEDVDETVNGDDNEETEDGLIDETEVDGSNEDEVNLKKEMRSEGEGDREQAASAEDVTGENSEDNDFDNFSEIKEVVEEIVDKGEEKLVEEQSKQDDNIQESSGLAVKLGVGIAILMVAHFVLVRKWRTADGNSKPTVSKEENEAVPDLSRRNTIVPPPSFQEIEPDLENDEEGIQSPKGVAENSDSDRQSDDEEYRNMNITNKDDFLIRNEIDEAQKSVESNPSYAVKLFDAILRKNPSSPRSLYGKAISLDALADQKQSNEILEKALTIYRELLRRDDVPPVLYKLVAERCINRMRFIGQYKNLVMVHQLVIQNFPDDPKYRNQLAVTYLTINRVENARSVLKDILNRWPNDGYALVHYGFILKTADNKLEDAVQYLRKGLKTRDEGVGDGRFYFHLGDALSRLGRTDEANKVYEEGADNKVFLSMYQRSLYNVPRLTGKPWWEKEATQNPLLFDLLEQYWKEIRREGLAILNEKGYFQDESENLKDTGDWKQFELYARGRKNVNNCQKCPVTCSVIDRIPEAKFCKRGQTKFSVMHPGTHVWPHCGPTNCRLRTHLGLRVPPKTFIRVADQIRSWEEGAVIVFDDSFEHEVWHNGTGVRLVLIVDIWHPELTPYEKKSLPAI